MTAALVTKYKASIAHTSLHVIIIIHFMSSCWLPWLATSVMGDGDVVSGKYQANLDKPRFFGGFA